MDSGMSHPHHEHEVKNYDRAFAVGILLNVVFVAIEAGFGFVAGSLALLADAGHNLSDVLSLLLAWGASLLARKAETRTRTYGFRKITIMASFISAVMLLVALGGIAWETVKRFSAPQPVDGTVVIAVAAIGVIINTFTALLFLSGQKHDLNIKGAFLHMAADAAVSLGVVVAGLVIMQTGWFLVDPVISMAIVIIILIGTFGLLRDSFNLSIDAVPRHIDIEKIRDYLSGLDPVCHFHDLHVWALSTTETALSVHIEVSHASIQNSLLEGIQGHLHDHCGIAHATIQVERHTGNKMAHDPRCAREENPPSGEKNGL
jgi:cobalt-zinc-cadmium efflux system protein